MQPVTKLFGPVKVEKVAGAGDWVAGVGEMGFDTRTFVEKR